MKTLIFMLLMCSSALAQQLPALDPGAQLGVCQQNRDRFLTELERATSYANQFFAEITDLKAKLAAAEAKLKANEK